MYRLWQSLPLHVRMLLATQFGVAKTGPTHVFDNRIESDGYKFEDVEAALSQEALEAYVGVTGNYDVLWNLTLNKVQGIEGPSIAAVVEEVVVAPTAPVDYKPAKYPVSAKTPKKSVKKSKK